FDFFFLCGNYKLGFRTMSFKICSLRLNLQGIRKDLVDISIKEIDKLSRHEITKVFHCNGLVLENNQVFVEYEIYDFSSNSWRVLRL
ncbi:hypothetical protein AALP_AA3G263900, partial [Arabis alpina]